MPFILWIRQIGKWVQSSRATTVNEQYREEKTVATPYLEFAIPFEKAGHKSSFAEFPGHGLSGNDNRASRDVVISER
jgi:hypothetical protein